MKRIYMQTGAQLCTLVLVWLRRKRRICMMAAASEQIYFKSSRFAKTKRKTHRINFDECTMNMCWPRGTTNTITQQTIFGLKFFIWLMLKMYIQQI